MRQVQKSKNHRDFRKHPTAHFDYISQDPGNIWNAEYPPFSPSGVQHQVKKATRWSQPPDLPVNLGRKSRGHQISVSLEPKGNGCLRSSSPRISETFENLPSQQGSQQVFNVWEDLLLLFLDSFQDKTEWYRLASVRKCGKLDHQLVPNMVITSLPGWTALIADRDALLCAHFFFLPFSAVLCSLQDLSSSTRDWIEPHPPTAPH